MIRIGRPEKNDRGIMTRNSYGAFNDLEEYHKVYMSDMSMTNSHISVMTRFYLHHCAIIEDETNGLYE